MTVNRWLAVAALLSAQNGYVLAEDQNSELARLKQQLHELDQKVRILENKGTQSAPAVDARAAGSPRISLGSGGLQISTVDTNFALKLRGYVQADGRFFAGDEEVEGNDTFLLRRVRPIFEGTVGRYFDYRLMLDFGAGLTTGSGNNGLLQDAYVNFRPWSEAQLQVGKFKEPVGLERQQSGANLLFIERGLPTQLVPNRDVGVQVHGQLWGKGLSYAVGVFNGVEDGASSDIETADDGKDVAARVFVHPFAATEIEALQNLGLGIAATHGDHEGALRNYSSAGQQTWFRWRTGAGTAAAPNVLADGDTARLAPQAYYYYGPFGIFGEYVVSSHDVTRTAGTSTSETFHNTAWQFAASWFLTGEKNSFGPVTPLKPFTVGGEGWGAFELAARVGNLSVDEDIFPAFATANSAREVTEWGVGLNWHLNRNVKATVNYIQSDFKGGGRARGDVTATDEHAVLARVQLSF